MQAPTPAPATATDSLSSWQTLITSALIIVSAFGGKYLHDKKGLDSERWWGIVYGLYNDAEGAGLLKNWSGREKLDHALAEFDTRFKAMFGAEPTSTDRRDLQADLARVAFHDDGGDTASAAPVALIQRPANPGNAKASGAPGVSVTIPNS